MLLVVIIFSDPTKWAAFIGLAPKMIDKDKAWTGYKITKRKGEHHASGIQKLQRELVDAGIASPQSLAIFPNIDEKQWLVLKIMVKAIENTH